ncbi:MAG: fructose 1,6-bisphosphatase [Deltaproteobacteria bacterium]|nr:fructose 1,6-bisphosphatase [Deltaproteobacteria bacterium]
MGEPELTLSVITADIGGFVGHVSSHPDVLDTAKERLYAAREKGAITDFHVLRCGDDLELIVTHRNGRDSRAFHELVWNILNACEETAESLKLHAAGRGLIKDAFKGNLRHTGPGVAEMEFEERASEPVVILMANKVSTGAWNLPLYRIFADPFNTTGLVMDPSMIEGFSFRVLDTKEESEVTLSAPRDTYYILALIGSIDRYVVTGVSRNNDGEICACASSAKYNMTGDGIAGKCEPSLIIRCQSGFPAVGEAMEAFAFPHLVEGWMQSSYNGPLMPVPFYEANPTRFDGPPRAIAAGFQLSGGRLIGPHDMFDDPSFDPARRTAGEVTDYMRRHGPFKPHRAALSGSKAASGLQVVDKIKDRFKKIE